LARWVGLLLACVFLLLLSFSTPLLRTLFVLIFLLSDVQLLCYLGLLVPGCPGGNSMLLAINLQAYYST
jgi:hypothetical protein